MAGAQSDPQKWNMPGWRIEQHFSNNTLIGNWYEERKRFHQGSHPSCINTHRIDYKLYPGHKPDVIVRRSGLIRNDGLDKQHVFNHHGKRYKNNMISWYDEQYNKRTREQGDELPDLRKWDGNKLAWLPERSDHPMQGTPTNFGLLPPMRQKWIRDAKALREGDYVTSYSRGFVRHPETSFPHRYASAPKSLSSHFNPISKLNKDLWLRKSAYNLAPEYPPQVSPPETA